MRLDKTGEVGVESDFGVLPIIKTRAVLRLSSFRLKGTTLAHHKHIVTSQSA